MIPQPSESWYVGFVACDNHGLWRLANRKFGHCMAFRHDPPVWILVEYNVFGLDVRVMSDHDIARLVEICHTTGRLLHVEGGPRVHRWLPPLALTCVTSIAGLLGQRLWCLTPKQLYGALLRRGATLVSPPMEEKSHEPVFLEPGAGQGRAASP